MKMTLKRTVLVLSLFAAGSLMAYGPRFGGPGYLGHHGAQHGGWGGHMLGAGYSPVAFVDGEADARLDQIKTALDIKPDQETAWNSFASSLRSHANDSKLMHETLWPDRGAVSAEEHDQVRQTLWQQRQAMHEAAGRLVDVLDEQQRLGAGDLIGYGLQHPF